MNFLFEENYLIGKERWWGRCSGEGEGAQTKGRGILGVGMLNRSPANELGFVLFGNETNNLKSGWKRNVSPQTDEKGKPPIQ